MTLGTRRAEITLQRLRVLVPLVVLAQLLSLVASESSGIPLTRTVIAVNMVLSALGISLAISLALHRIPLRWAHPISAAVWCSPVVTSLCSFLATRQEHLLVLLIFEMMAGSVLLSSPWVAAMFIAFDLAWFPIAVIYGGDAAVFDMLAIVVAQVFGFVVHRLKLHSLVQAEELRIEAERQLGELQASELARAELADQLVHAQRLEAVGTLAAGLAHDMNNVLAAIMGLADGLAETIEDPQARTDATEILREAERGAELTRGLLTFSRRGQYRKQVMRVSDLIDDMVSLLGRTLPKTVELDKQLGDVEACVEGDPTQFSQALVNLGINASDAMSGKGKLVVRGATIDVEAGSPLQLSPGRYVRLEVADTGTGMDAATRARVFEPFFTTKPMGKGTGLGLALVWGVVKKARGTVTVDSHVGTGSTFSIFLPLSVKRPKSTSTTVRPVQIHGRGTVLVIDDEPGVRTSTTRMLERLGLQTLAAGGGVEGLALYDQRAADIGMVVLDMGMPGMNGAEVFRELRQRGGVHVLIATGYALEEEVQQLVAAGARLIEKPFKLDALELEVERALPRAQSRQVAHGSA